MEHSIIVVQSYAVSKAFFHKIAAILWDMRSIVYLLTKTREQRK